MKTLFSYFKIVLGFIPFSLARIPYALTYKLALWKTGLSPSDLWPRNSYYFKRIVMLVSDLDLTLFVVKGNSLSQETKNRVSWIQRFLPLVGELNVVSEELTSKYVRFLPVLELKRDPILLRRIQLTLREAHEVEKFFFLWRMLWSDRKNLRSNPQMRKKKWAFHLESLQLDSDSFGKISNLGDFLKILDSQFECSTGYLQQLPLREDREYDSLRADLKLVFFLADWLGEVYQYNRWENEESWPTLEPRLHKILEYSLSWELWGVLTQLELETDLVKLYLHINGLKKISLHYSFDCYLPVLVEAEGLILNRMALSPKLEVFDTKGV
jgi:hypothetical protein